MHTRASSRTRFAASLLGFVAMHGCASELGRSPSIDAAAPSSVDDAAVTTDADLKEPLDNTPSDAAVADAEVAPTRWAVSEPSAQVAAWRAYERAPTYDVVSSPVRVPMRDGAELACTLGRPGHGLTPAEGKFPGLVLELTPYYLLGTFFSQEAAFFSARGYNTLFCTLRGIGGSGGTWPGSLTAQERRDAYDLVEWLATQPWSDGRIGMFGESYGGYTTNGCATEKPPHLLAVAPLQSAGSFFDDVTYPGGIEAVRDGTINSWPPIGQLTSLGVVNAEAEYAAWQAHPTYDAFWQERTVSPLLTGVDVPTLAVGGWIDVFFRAGTIANITAGRAHTWAFYGQWTHTYPVDLDSCSGFVPCVDEPLPSGILLAWFDRWVMQLTSAPIPERPTFISEEGPRGAGRGWRELASWLGRAGPTTRVYPTADGGLGDAAARGTLRFREPAEATEPGGALTFTGAPLDRDRTILGHATLTLRATLSAADAHFYVQLLDVASDGTETLVNDGFLKASFRASKTAPTPVPVDEPVDYTIDIRPQHYRVLAQHRLRLRLWGGAKDTLVQPAAVDVQVHLEGSALDLPGWE